jgi:putative FmdB family regulatory protein
MPLYEYECASCRKRFELRQKVTEDALSVCPSCGGVVRRVIHPVGIIFKGSGFYVTDNRKSEAPATTGNGDAPAASKDSDGGKVESGTKSESATKTESGSKSDSRPDSGAKSDSGSKSAPVPSGNRSGSSSDSASKTGAGKDTASS